ncbi:hypothetical protein Tco_0131230, partial [Tanacetum coccineum]
TDIAKISRKRLKPDNHEHGNGRAHKSRENAIKGQPKSTHGQQKSTTKKTKPKNS